MKKFKFFWGFLDAQAKWLNKMSAKGLRLTEVNVGTYEFSECTPNKYTYAVEYIGNKSFADGADYKKFLEDMGYVVYYKNLNLDYSFLKVEVRPWADKGGRIATDKTTHNRELLIVEKENDGKPLELHTTASDRISVYRAFIKPPLFCALPLIIIGAFMKLWYLILIGLLFAAPAVINAVKIVKLKKTMPLEEQAEGIGGYKRSDFIILSLVIICSVAIGNFAGKVEPSSFAAVGYVGTATFHKWEARYVSLNGRKNHKLSVDDGTLDISIVTKSGELAFKVVDSDGNVLLSEKASSSDSESTKEETFSASVPVEGKVSIELDAHKHSGKYSFK